MQHLGYLRLPAPEYGTHGASPRAGGPAEVADGQEQPAEAPDRDDQEVPPVDRVGAAGHVGVEEGEEEVADREDVGEGDDAARELVVGDEDAAEEVERQEDEVDDRGGGVLGRDRRGERDAQGGEGGGADRQHQQDLRDPSPGEADAVDEAADHRQQGQHHDGGEDR